MNLPKKFKNIFVFTTTLQIFLVFLFLLKSKNPLTLKRSW
nr:MAG TPA: hypothetical protein [Caudoviricetes sp.]